VTVKRVMVAFAISLGVSVLILLPLQLGRHHHASQKVGVQVGAGAVMDLGVAVVLWLLVVAGMAVANRPPGARGGKDDPALHDASGARTGTEAEASFGGR
jgi:hypothetical protein